MDSGTGNGVLRGHGRKPKVCFFAPVRDLGLLDRGFYRLDIELLESLDLDVRVATRWSQIPWKADLYYVWWWTWAFMPLVKARLSRSPVAVTGVFNFRWPVAGHDYFSRSLWQRWLLRLGLRADANIFISQNERSEVAGALRTRNPWYIPLAVDATRYGDSWNHREALVLTVAWLHRPNAERKGIPEIIRSIPLVRARHPQVRYVIAGEHASGYPELIALARTLGVQDAVEFPGAISETDKIDLMQRCQVYLQPSMYEGFGLAVLEAMSCGAPVVCTSAGALPEVVGDAGLFIEDRKPAAIASAIDRLLNDRELRHDLGRRARARAETEFPLCRRRDALAEVIGSLLGEPSSSASGSRTT